MCHLTKIKKENAKKVLIPKVFFKITALVLIIAVLFVIGLNLQKKGVLHRNLFEDKSTVLAGQYSTDILSNSGDMEQTQIYSYKKKIITKIYSERERCTLVCIPKLCEKQVIA